MKLFYHRFPSGIINFGDNLNPWIWERLLPKGFLDSDERHLFVGIGTLLNDKLPAADRTSVFGSGVGYGNRPSIVDGNWDFYAVRGPLSAQALEIDDSHAITDGAYLLRQVIREHAEKEHAISYMPHFRLAKPALRSWCGSMGIHYIDPSAPIEHTLEEIQKTKFLLTEAMHGAIVADCFRIPWLPVKSSKSILDFKWQDWCQSMNLEFDPVRIFPVWEPKPASIRKSGINFVKSTLNSAIFKRAISGRTRLLSDPRLSDLRFRQLQEKLESLIDTRTAAGYS